MLSQALFVLNKLRDFNPNYSNSRMWGCFLLIIALFIAESVCMRRTCLITGNKADICICVSTWAKSQVCSICRYLYFNGTAGLMLLDDRLSNLPLQIGRAHV